MINRATQSPATRLALAEEDLANHETRIGSLEKSRLTFWIVVASGSVAGWLNLIMFLLERKAF